MQRCMVICQNGHTNLIHCIGTGMPYYWYALMQADQHEWDIRSCSASPICSLPPLSSC